MAAVKQEQKQQDMINQKLQEERVEKAETEKVIAAASKLERETAAAIALVNATIQKAATERHEKQAAAEAGRKREEDADARDGHAAEAKHSEWLKSHSSAGAAAVVDEKFEATMSRIRAREKARAEERRREEEEERRLAAEEEGRLRARCACCRMWLFDACCRRGWKPSARATSC
jgi:dTMP kinase